jgi:hypothetical protein
MTDHFLRKIPAASRRAHTEEEADWIRQRLAENRLKRFLLIIVIISILLILYCTLDDCRLWALLAALPGLTAGAFALRVAGRTKDALTMAGESGFFAGHGIRIEQPPADMKTTGRRGLGGWIYALKKDVWTLLDLGDTVEMRIVPGARMRLTVEKDGHVLFRIGPILP